MRISTSLRIFILLHLFLLSLASGDVVTTKDGRQFQGTVVEHTDSTVKIDTVIHNIRTTLTFSKDEVESVIIVKDNQAEGQDGEVVDASETEGTQTSHLVIPMVGTFGEDILAPGVEDALRFAKRRGVNHIIFYIDSGGGSVTEADAIAKVIDRYSEFRYTCVVKRAISASIWILSRCDEIVVENTATMGGAVIFTEDRDGKKTAVDKKFESIVLADIGTSAINKGHSPHIFAAMIVLEKELYAILDENGQVVSVHDTPEKGIDSNKIRQYDSSTTVLTLRSDQAIELGFASSIGSESLELFRESKSISRYGYSAMTRAAEERKKLSTPGKEPLNLDEILEEELRDLINLVGLAESQDPSKFSDYEVLVNGSKQIWAGTRLQTLSQNVNPNIVVPPSTRRMWRSRTDRAIKSWESVRTSVMDINRLVKEPGRQGPNFEISSAFDPPTKQALEMAMGEAKTQISRLSRGKNL